MSAPFVWFHNSSKDLRGSVTFYAELLSWTPGAGPAGMTMFEGAKGPFAAISADGGPIGWIPFVEVEDLDAATKRAQELGANLLKAKTRGPAGEYAVVRDPGGAAVALWQKA